MSASFKHLSMMVLSLGAGTAVLAQQPVKESPLQVNYCRAEASVLSQEQDGSDVSLEMEVKVENCGDVCTGSVEYDLVFTDDRDKEIRWHKIERWDWMHVEDSFVMNIDLQAIPGTILQQVENISTGRCSNSKRQEFNF